jgi:GT2 family glycosyltransferase/glycosyltransferase involved in cell wall biosynthesis
MPHPLADAIPADCVTIVIPIYGGLVETMCCLRSVRVARNATKLRVLLIDDCSPDAALSLAVAQFAAQSGFLHRRLTRNLGFVGTVNLGMAAFPEDDVVLLNADTEVPDFWLDRLHEAAYRHPRIASVTPMSNNASVMSIPVMGGRPELPGGRRLAELDDLCRDLDDGVLHDTPTAHGFCMYIRRDALDDVGLFDAELFGRGYGEENDFSLRARARGWRNVVTGGLFVRHTGSVSFSTAQEALLARNLALLNARHPGYEQEVAAFIAIDPLRRLRARVQLALWKQAGPVVVMVVLGLPGGTMRHVASLSRDIENMGRVVLWVQSDTEHAVTLSDPADDALLRYAGPRGEAELLGDLLALDPGFVHVHHVLDLSSGIASLLLRSGLPIIVTAHDYFFGCPRVTLLDAGGGFCGAPAAEFCAPCLDASPHEALHPSLRPLASDGVKWRGHWAPLLARAHQIIVPSRAAAFYMGRMFEGLDFSVRQHPAGLLHAAPEPQGARDPARIAVIGAIGPHKGSALLHDLIAHCHRHEPDLRFVIIGHTDRDALLRRYGNVELTGKYDPDDALAMIAKASCVCALFLSPWPETYCFTLSEALLAGLVPVALDRGAISERLRDLGQGIVLPLESGVAGIVAALREAGTRALAPILPPLRIDGVYDDLFAEYYAPLPEVTHAPLLLGPGHGVSGDLWCARRFELPLYLRLPRGVHPSALVLQLWNHVTHPGQRVVAWIEGAPPQRGFLAEGEVTDLRLDLPQGQANLLWLRCEFERADPLGGGDTRLAAATLFGLALVMPDGEIIACRVLPAEPGGQIGLAVSAPSPAPAMAAPSG